MNGSLIFRKFIDVLIYSSHYGRTLVEREFSSKEVNVQRYLRVLLTFLAGSFFSSPVISSLRATNFDAGGRNCRIKSRRKARVVATPRGGWRPSSWLR